MATLRKIGEKWVCDYYDGRGKRHREYRRTKQEAQDLMAQRLGEIKKGSFRSDGRTKKFDAFAREWITAKASKWSVNTQDLYRQKVEKYLLRRKWLEGANGEQGGWEALEPDFGLASKRVVEIDLETCEKFKADLVENCPEISDRTRNMVLITLGAILKHAQRHGYRVDNPVRLLDKFPEKRRDVDPLTPTEAERLLAKAKGEPVLYAIVLLALKTGMRLGEILALRWRDLDGQSLAVKGTNSHKDHRKLFQETGEFGDTKTEHSRRKVLLSGPALRALKEYRLMMGNPKDPALIFATGNGHPIDPKNFRDRQWRPLLKKAEIAEGTKFHGLRHTYASHMLANGAPVEFVQRQLGHSSYQTTLNIYRHWIPERDDLHAETIERALAVASGQ